MMLYFLRNDILGTNTDIVQVKVLKLYIMEQPAKISDHTLYFTCHIKYISVTERNPLSFNRNAGSNVCSKKTTWEKIIKYFYSTYYVPDPSLRTLCNLTYVI